MIECAEGHASKSASEQTRSLRAYESWSFSSPLNQGLPLGKCWHWFCEISSLLLSCRVTIRISRCRCKWKFAHKVKYYNFILLFRDRCCVIILSSSVWDKYRYINGRYRYVLIFIWHILYSSHNKIKSPLCKVEQQVKIRMYNRFLASHSTNDRRTNRNCSWRRSIPAAQNKCLVSRWFTNPRVSIRGDREKRISLQSNGPIAAVCLVSTRNKFRQRGISRQTRSRMRYWWIDDCKGARQEENLTWKRETPRGEEEIEQLLQGEVSLHTAAWQEHTCNRWKAGIEHLVYFNV